jgi:Holliday junction resolvase RusA-like endonuclease
VITIEVPGEPRGMGRPRFSRFGGSHVYTDEKSRDYMRAISWAAKAAMAGRTMLSGPVCVVVDAFFSVKPSWARAKLRAALNHLHRPGKPDWDNIGKICCDGLNGIAWTDDAQVADGRVRKFYTAKNPRLVITVTPAQHEGTSLPCLFPMDGTKSA